MSEKEASGMTVNERLYLADLMEDFDEALSENNKTKLKTILEKIYLPQEDIQFIIEQLLK